MAKATLEFDLNEFDDRIAHMRAVKSTDMAIALHELIYNTKKSIEYELEGKDIKGEQVSNYQVLELVFERIYEVLEDSNIEIDELIH